MMPTSATFSEIRLEIYTLNERKSRMRQIRGVEGEAVVNLLRALDNNGDGVSSAFPSGKQNEDYIHIL